MSDLDEVVREFLVESYEGLDELDQLFVSLEQDPHSPELLSTIFRVMHTIKGTAGLLGYNRLVSLTHAAESMLVRMRDGMLTLTPDITTTLLKSGDGVRQMLEEVESSGSDGELDYSDLVVEINELIAGGIVEDVSEVDDTIVPEEQGTEAVVVLSGSTSGSSAPAPASSQPPKPVEAAGNEGLRPAADQTQGGSSDELVDEPAVVSVQKPAPPVTTESKSEPATEPAQTVSDSAVQAPTPADAGASTMVDSTVRVDVGLLDPMLDLVGELVLARNRLLQLAVVIENRAFQTTSHDLNLVTSDLQERVMKLRMQPLGNILSKLPRTVRDLAVECGRQARIVIEGKETELDKTLIESVRDPITHLIRNAVDHGLESPDERIAAGKPAEGLIQVRAYHEGGLVIIEIADDGRGIDAFRLKEIAIRKGLVADSDASVLNERQMLHLLFLPGFSTTDVATSVSGRGVGMDVVKTNIERIGGTIDIDTSLGEGTSIKLKIPLTLAIIPTLIVECRGERYAIPQVSLLQLIRLKADNVAVKIEMIDETPVFRLRGNLIPLVYLHEQLKLPRENDDTPPGDSGDSGRRKVSHIVVLEANGRRFGVVVDDILDSQEIVSKPLARQLKSIPCYAGATIMGDGRAAMILDVVGLAQSSSLISDSRRQLPAEVDETVEESDLMRTLLLVEVTPEHVLAVPMNQVAQLQRFRQTDIKRVGRQNVVRYRDMILPLHELSSLLPDDVVMSAAEATARRTTHTLIVQQGEQQLGVTVWKIRDVVEASTDIMGVPGWEASLGSIAWDDTVIEIVDVERIVSDSIKHFTAEPVASPG